MGNGARASGWGRREDEEQDVLLLPWQDSMGCKTIKRRWSSVASKANHCWCPACSLSPTLYSCLPPCTPVLSLHYLQDSTELTVRWLQEMTLQKAQHFFAVLIVSCVGWNAFLWLAAYAGKSPPILVEGSRQGRAGAQVHSRWDTDELEDFWRCPWDVQRISWALAVRSPPRDHLPSPSVQGISIPTLCSHLLQSTSFYSSETEVSLWQELWIDSKAHEASWRQNACDSYHKTAVLTVLTDGSLDVRTVSKKVRCTAVASVKTRHDEKYPFCTYTHASQKPELSFCTWPIKTYFLCYTCQFSFVFFYMMNKCEHLGLVSHSCEIPLTGIVHKQILSKLRQSGFL